MRIFAHSSEDDLDTGQKYSIAYVRVRREPPHGQYTVVFEDRIGGGEIACPFQSSDPVLLEKIAEGLIAEAAYLLVRVHGCNRGSRMPQVHRLVMGQCRFDNEKPQRPSV